MMLELIMFNMRTVDSFDLLVRHHKLYLVAPQLNIKTSVLFDSKLIDTITTSIHISSYADKMSIKYNCNDKPFYHKISGHKFLPNYSTITTTLNKILLEIG